MPYLTTLEAAARLKVSDAYVRQLILDRRIRAKRLGGVHVIQESDLEAFAVNRRPRGRPKGSTRRRRRSRAA